MELTFAQAERMMAIHAECGRLLQMLVHYKKQAKGEREFDDDADQDLIKFFDEQVDRYETSYAQELLKLQKFLHDNIPA